MRICIDTNAYSDLHRGDAHIREILERADEILVPAIVIGELKHGFLRGGRYEENERMLDDFLAVEGVSVQLVTFEIADRYAYVKAALWASGHPIPENDVWIAATALETGARLLSRDAHFDHVGGLVKIS